MNGADLLVAALENEGVKQIFGVPGEENLDVVEALRRSTIKLVVTRHEQAAAFMAATQGRLTGEAGMTHRALAAMSVVEQPMNGQFVLTSVISLVLLVLSGCASPEELRARDEAVCAGYGFVQGTTDFARCLQQESLARQYYRQYYLYDYSYGPGYFYGPGNRRRF